MKREHIGTDFDVFLEEDGLLSECAASALKRVAAWPDEPVRKTNPRRGNDGDKLGESP